MNAVENCTFNRNFRIHDPSACRSSLGTVAYKPATGRQPGRGFESCVLKRFTETTKWDDSWFMGLSPVAKLLWLYLCDHCDNAGVIDLNAKLAAFQIGQAIEKNHFVELGARITTLENGKLWLPKFIKFQYGTLSGGSLVHQSVVRLIQAHSLSYPTPCLTHSQASDMGCASHKEKEKRKEKVQEEEKDRKGVQGETRSGLPATKEEAIEWAGMEAVPAEFAAALYAQMESVNWIDGAQRQVTNFRAYVKSRFSRQKTAAGNGSLSGAERVSAEKEIERIAIEKKKIRDGYESHMDWNQPDRVRFKELKAREADLKKSLGAIA